MCRLRKRKVTNVDGAIQAFHDNNDESVVVDEIDDGHGGFGLICSTTDDVELAAETLLYNGSMQKAVYVSPYMA